MPQWTSKSTAGMPIFQIFPFAQQLPHDGLYHRFDVRPRRGHTIHPAVVLRQSALPIYQLNLIRPVSQPISLHGSLYHHATSSRGSLSGPGLDGTLLTNESRTSHVPTEQSGQHAITSRHLCIFSTSFLTYSNASRNDAISASCQTARRSRATLTHDTIPVDRQPKLPRTYGKT